MTYQELKEQTHKLAVILQAKGLQPERAAAIMVERSLEMIIGILAILKAGAAYLPIEPGYPQDRINYMLKDSGASILLATEDTEDTEGVFPTLLPCCPSTLQCSHLHQSPAPAASLAYIIYTSGTTGKPKGVTMEHKGVVNTLLNRKEEYGMNVNHIALQLFSCAFDGFVTSFFTPVISGAQVVLVSREDIARITKIKEVITKNQVTHMISVPALYRAIIESLTPGEAASLQVITLAGDRLSPDIIETTKAKSRKIEIANEYGVTEAAVMSTIYRHQERDTRITIGRPIGNTRLYIVDKEMKLQPIGIPGELCIGGIGTARGYLNNPELTCEIFCLRRPGGALFEKTAPPGPPGKNFLLMGTKNNQKLLQGSPDASRDGFLEKSPPGRRRQKIYKTGDLARWYSDSNIEFLGRIDHQVKVRGYRIELGEIENCLKEMDIVKETVVIHKKDKTGETFLCAYIVPGGAREKQADIPRLKRHLAARLPYFMIPAYIIEMETIPLTPNGKVDMKALPAPRINARPGISQPPADELETQIAGIWQEVLGVKSIGSSDNFFEIGGDSIKALQVSARLQQKGIKLEISDLYANPTIKQAREKIKTSDTPADTPQGPVIGEVKLTPIQEWYFKTPLTRAHHFNQAVMLYSGRGFAEKIIEKVFTALVKHHDALRMVYTVNAGQVQQRNRGYEQPLFHLMVKDMSGSDPGNIAGEIEEQANKIHRAIDISKGPLVHLGLFKTTRGDHLLIVIHHLVVDAVSWRILLEDFARGISQAQKGEAIVFPEKNTSYQKWARELSDYSQSKQVLEELPYWQAVEQAKNRETSKEEKKNKHVETITFSIDEEKTARLREKSTTPTIPPAKIYY